MYISSSVPQAVLGHYTMQTEFDVTHPSICEQQLHYSLKIYRILELYETIHNNTNIDERSPLSFLHCTYSNKEA